MKTLCYNRQKEGEKMLEETITIRVTKEQKQELQERANKEKRSLSNYIKVLIGLL